MPDREDTAAARRVRTARVAVSAGFFMFGLAFGLWAVHIPVLTKRLDLDPAILGLALLNVGLGGVISQPLTGWLVARTGSRPATQVLLFLFLATFSAPIIARNTVAFFCGAFVLGATGGAINVAINTQAAEIERARGRPTMSSFHGFFSLGGLSGAALGGSIIAVGWQDGRGALAVAVVMLAAAVFVGSHLLPSTPAAPSAAKRTKRFALPSPAVLGLVVLTFFANTVEGSANDWSSLYLSTVRGFSPAAAAAGLALFACGMAICRLFGGPVVARLGERRVVAWGGALVTIGMAVVVFSPWTLVSPAGFALVALGAANAIPIMMGAASRIPGEAPSAGVAATATGALLGFLIGPPVIGFIAHAHGLSTALSCICLVGLILLVGALVYRWQPAR